MEPIGTIALLVAGAAALSLAAWRIWSPAPEPDGYGERFQRAQFTFTEALALAMEERAARMASEATPVSAEM